MSKRIAITEVLHCGPSIDYVGGMASVIATLVTNSLGAEKARAVPTWVPQSHFKSGWLTARAAMKVLCLPRSTAVHVHMSEGGSFLRETIIVAAARLRCLSRVVTIHGPGFAAFSARHKHLVGMTLNLANVVTVLSDTDLAVVNKLALSIHAELLPNPMSLDLDAGPVTDTPELVLFAGEIGLRKGADILRRAWDEVARRRPQAKCLIVGPGTELHLAEAERLDVRGPIEPNDVRQLIRKARVIALPSRGEALPMILIEAMAAGRPFVSTATGGVTSLAGCGIIVPIEDYDALAEALIELLEDPKRAQSLGSAGQLLCQERMSLGVIGTRLRRLYTNSWQDFKD